MLFDVFSVESQKLWYDRLEALQTLDTYSFSEATLMPRFYGRHLAQYSRFQPVSNRGNAPISQPYRDMGEYRFFGTHPSISHLAGKY